MDQVSPPSAEVMRPPQCPELTTATPSPISLLEEGPHPAQTIEGAPGSVASADMDAQFTGWPSRAFAHLAPSAPSASWDRHTPPLTEASSQRGSPPGPPAARTTCWTALAEAISAGSPRWT